MRYSIAAILLLACLSVGSIDAQEGDDLLWYVDKPITEIVFEGLNNISEDELTGIVTPFVNRPFSDSLFLDLQRRLYALEYFSEILANADRTDPEGTSVTIRFSVVEFPLVEEIRFLGNDNTTNRELRDVVLLKDGDILTSASIRIDEVAIRTLYVELGFSDVTVEGMVLDVTDTDNQIVEFRIDEGTQVLIREIRFHGNSVFSGGTLRGVMESKSKALFNRGTFQESELQEDRRRIERYYQERGYVDTTVVEVIRESERDLETGQLFLTLTIFIEEGEQFLFGGIRFEGNSIFSDKELEALLRMKAGDVHNIIRVERDLQNVRDLYFNDGYIFNNIVHTEERDAETRTISYLVSIVERDRAHIENIIIVGNTKTRDYVIERELPFEEGDVFSADTIRAGVLRLQNLQYFSSIIPETPQGSVEGLLDLIINVGEGNTADIQFGLAFGGNSDFPVALRAQWQERNLAGRGHTLSVGGTLAPNQQNVTVAFTEPWLLGNRLGLGFDVSFNRRLLTNIRQDIIAPIFADDDDNAVPDPYTGAYVFSEDTVYEGVRYEAGDFFPGVPTDDDIDDHDLETDYEYAGGVFGAPIASDYLMEYVLWNIGVGTSLSHRIPTPVGLVTLSTRLSTELEIIDYDNDIYRPFSTITRNSLGRPIFINRLALRASLDTRDLRFSPSSGYLASQRLIFTGGFLLGDRHYIRSDTGGEIFFTLFDLPVGDTWNFKTVLGIQSVFSLILPHFVVPPRYADDPQPVATISELLFIDGIFNARGWPRRLNGEAFWNSWLELRIPIAEQIIWFDNFIEMATLWQDRNDVLLLNGEDLLFSIGAGVRFVIPQFPIRFYFVKRFRFVNGEIEWQTAPLFNGQNKAGAGLNFVFSFGTGLF